MRFGLSTHLFHGERLSRQHFETIRASGFDLVDDSQRVGLLVWEAAECVGVAGRHPTLDAFVARLCEDFGARFERIEG